jgi:hypothetical protein
MKAGADPKGSRLQFIKGLTSALHLRQIGKGKIFALEKGSFMSDGRQDMDGAVPEIERG